MLQIASESIFQCRLVAPDRINQFRFNGEVPRVAFYSLKIALIYAYALLNWIASILWKLCGRSNIAFLFAFESSVFAFGQFLHANDHWQPARRAHDRRMLSVCFIIYFMRIARPLSHIASPIQYSPMDQFELISI